MAYIRSNNEDDQDPQVQNNETPVISSQGAGLVSADAQTAGAVGSAPSANTQKPGAGGFTNLQRYLGANQGGANILGEKVGSYIDQSANKAKTGIANSAQNFTNEVQSGTNIWNQSLADQAAQDASTMQFDTGLNRQLSGQYLGPQNFVGSESAAEAQKSVGEAQRNANFATDVGGRTQLLRNVVNPTGTQPSQQTSSGGLNLNQFLLQNTQPAYEKVFNAAEGVKPVGELFNTTAQGLQGKVSEATKTSQETRDKTLTRLSQGSNDIVSQINATLAQRQAQENALAEANNQSLLDSVSGNITRGTPPAGSPALAATPGSVAPGVLQSYLTPGVAARLGRGDVASEKQVADLAALSRLTGLNMPDLLKGLAGQDASYNYGGLINFLNQQTALGAPGGVINPGDVYGVGGTKWKPMPVIPGQTPSRNPSAGGSSGFDGGGDGTGGTSGGSSGGISANDNDTGNAPGVSSTSNSVSGAIGAAIGTAIGIGAAVGSAIGQAVNGAVNADTSAAAAAANAAAAAQADAQAAENDAIAAAANAAASGGGGVGAGSADGTAGVGVGEGGIGSSGAGTAAGDAAGNSEGSGGAADGSGSAGDGGDGGGAGAGGSGVGSDGSGDGTGSGSGSDGGGGGTGVGSSADGSGSGSDGSAEGSDGGGGGGGGGKIICTAMNDYYGLPYRENKVWIKYGSLNMKPEHQVGYHKVFLPLVDFGFKRGDGVLNLVVRNSLIWVGRERTRDIEDELAGRNPRPIKRALLRKPIEKFLYYVGKWSKK